MDLMGISISTGSACNSKSKEISHVLKAIKLDENLARGTIRVSLGKDNTAEDVDAIATVLIKATPHKWLAHVLLASFPAYFTKISSNTQSIPFDFCFICRKI